MVALPWTTAVGLGAEATMSRPRVVIASLWRNDVERNIGARCDHLLCKTSDRFDVRWLWLTGDNDDDTFNVLLERAADADDPDDVFVVWHDSNIKGEDIMARRQRLSHALQGALDQIGGDGNDLVLWHESDLLTSPYVVDQLARSLDVVWESGWWGLGGVVAGWPVIELDGRDQFYDIWAFRDMRGRPFDARGAMADGQERSAALLEVTSLGSVWMAHAGLVQNRTITQEAIVELCAQWRRERIRLWADTTIEVRQPVELWTPC